ncbi:DNA-3-methyladenine glycosylase I [Listeria sp. PSOL-1]|uniref:DNA-3-methyladenine glycosylase I n=1 Tax=Listeria sp. PSOL-1 TaxID=1844999 RepID=UPI0013D1A31E|nr:DNA-3-methyladenine glycosylase I [Listeria sp. PSOL-1]
MTGLPCAWARNNPLMLKYHDEEWCVPSYDDRYLFEMLNLEGAQAGLSWQIILNKRAGYKAAFKNFEIERCAALTDKELEEIRLRGDIIRNRLKIQAVRTNAKAAQNIQIEFGSLANYMWHFTNQKRVIHQVTSEQDRPVKNNLSKQISADLKKRGFKFVGEIIIYSYLQAIGIIEDHQVTCPKYNQSLT